MKEIIVKVLIVITVVVLLGSFVFHLLNAIEESKLTITDLAKQARNDKDKLYLFQLRLKYPNDRFGYVMHRALANTANSLNFLGVIVLVVTILSINNKEVLRRRGVLPEEKEEEKTYYKINGELVEKEDDTYRRDEFKFY